jgi:hypothetical protein
MPLHSLVVFIILHSTVSRLALGPTQLAVAVPSDPEGTEYEFDHSRQSTTEVQMLRFWTSSIVLSLSKTPSCIFSRTQRFGDWILSPSSGKKRTLYDPIL